MSDITKCEWINCTKKEQCYRFTAIDNKFRQSYFDTIPDVINCEYFINNK